MKRVLVFLYEDKLSPRGGPNGVGYYLKKGFDEMKIEWIDFLKSPKDEKNSFLKKFIRLFIFPVTSFDFNVNDYDVIHFHTTRDLFYYRKALRKFNGKVILTSHSPEPPARETMNRIKNRVPKILTSFLYKLFQQSDKYAFLKTDYIIFPCEGAMEPYYNNWVEFSSIIKKKRVEYVLTGINQCASQRDKMSVRRELGIPEESVVISFVGRHNYVKGYFDLQQIGRQILDNNKNTYFLIAGNQDGIPGLDNERWIEIGYTKDAYSYINASDIFVLPNKETYFDLVMIEALSLGMPVVASRTGGNKYYEEEKAKGVVLYNSISECCSIISNLINDRDGLLSMGKSNLEFYKTNLTTEKMCSNYINVLNRILEDC